MQRRGLINLLGLENVSTIFEAGRGCWAWPSLAPVAHCRLRWESLAGDALCPLASTPPSSLPYCWRLSIQRGLWSG